MPNENESYLRFSLEESVWFQKGQEVEELYSISLEPNVTLTEDEHYVYIRGTLDLSGEYRNDSGEEENQDFISSFLPKSVQSVERHEDGMIEFMHRFPVDITIPSSRIVSLADIDVTIQTFDYDTPERNCLKLQADLFISGIYGESYVEPREYEEEVWDEESMVVVDERVEDEEVEEAVEIEMDDLLSQLDDLAEHGESMDGIGAWLVDRKEDTDHQVADSAEGSAEFQASDSLLPDFQPIFRESETEKGELYEPFIVEAKRMPEPEVAEELVREVVEPVEAKKEELVREVVESAEAKKEELVREVVEPVEAKKEELVREVVKPVEEKKEELVREVVEPVEAKKEELVREVVEPVEAKKEESVREVVKPVEVKKEELVREVVKPVEAKKEELVREVVEPVEAKKEELVREVVEPVEAKKEELVREVVEPVEAKKEELVREVVEPVEAKKKESVREVVKPVEEKKEELVREVVEPVEEKKEELVREVVEPVKGIATEQTYEVEQVLEVKQPAEAELFHHVVKKVERPAAPVTNLHAEREAKQTEQPEPKVKEKESLSIANFFSRKKEEEHIRVKICIVQHGETVDDLAERYSVSVHTLLQSNELQPNQDIYEGQVLYIPKSHSYKK